MITEDQLEPHAMADCQGQGLAVMSPDLSGEASAKTEASAMVEILEKIGV
jgi:hypothetical protein